jgi:hypothetical protein
MALPNGEQALDVRDAKGAILGFFLPEKEYRELLSERDSLRKELTTLQENVEELRKERACYVRMLEAWEKEGVAPFTRIEVENLEREGLSFATVVSEIEAMMRSVPEGT